MKISQAEFVMSSPGIHKCPPESLPEFVFIGRSNVGKSSLINMIVGKKGMAKTSSTPGKTQLINHFIVNNAWFLVDLPGFGYAKISRTQSEKWNKQSKEFMQKRKTIRCIFVLIDSRLEPQKIDLDFLSWLASEGLAFVMVFTKSDKISNSILDKNVHAYFRTMKMNGWTNLPGYFVTSAEKVKGRDELLSYVAELIKDPA